MGFITSKGKANALVAIIKPSKQLLRVDSRSLRSC